MATKTQTASGTWATDSIWSLPGAPTSFDDAVIGSSTGLTLIGSGGNSARLTAIGTATLMGSTRTGALAVGTAAAAGALTLASGAILAATSANLLFGPLTVTGPNTRLVVTGALSFGGSRTNPLVFSSNALNLASGGAAQVASVAMTPNIGGATIAIDALSSLEIGTTGGAAAGRLTIDADGVLAGSGAVSAPAITNQGRIVAQGGTLSVAAPIDGAGSMQIGAGATLYLYAGASSQPIAFTGAGATLEVTTATLRVGTVFTSVLSAQGLISGFVATDVIYYAGNAVITSAIWTPGTAGQGTLTLRSGSAAAGTLALAGNYAGQSFVVTPHGSFGYDIKLNGVVGAGAPSAGTATADVYAWTATAGGVWNDAANWSDITRAQASAALAPGSRNSVTIAGLSDGSYQVVSGSGNAASTVLLDNALLGGTFDLGALSVSGPTHAANLSLGLGTTVAASSLTMSNGSVQVNGGGTSLLVSGAAVVSGAASPVYSNGTPTLSAAAGGLVRVGGLTLAASALKGAVTVDASSTLEVGGTGTAAVGTLTVDAGALLFGAGTVSAAGGIRNAGTIQADGGTLAISGGISGPGVALIDSGATLALSGAISTGAVAFTGAVGTLQLTPLASGSSLAIPFAGTVSGLAGYDTLWIDTPASVTTATYRATAFRTGVLTISGASGVLGTIGLSGDYGGASFRVSAHVGQGWTVTAGPPDALFDVAYYMSRYLDVTASGTDPYTHYMTYGWREGRDPSALFDTKYYLSHNLDVLQAGVNPLLHYEQYGFAESRNPDAWFDSKYYLAQNPDVAASIYSPLAHFQQYGWKEGREPSLVFSDAKYLAAYRDVALAGGNPLAHYTAYGQFEGRLAFLTGGTAPADPLVDTAFYDKQLGATLIPGGLAGAQQAAWSYDTSGWQKGLNPDAWFDTAYYLAHNPDVAAAHTDPLRHYETFGWKEHRDPSAAFSTDKYLAAYADVAAAHINPLQHYVQYGQFERRIAFTA